VVNTQTQTHEYKHKYRDEGLTPKIPDDCPPLLAEIMQMCWNKDPNQRPVSFLSLIDFVHTHY
jgi:hypothetical protein